MQPRVQRGQPVLINYNWTNTRWDEIESRIVGLCAWEARAGEQGLGPEGGAYVEQLVVALRRGGIGAMMLRAVRRSCGAQEGGRGQKRGRSEEQKTRSERVTKAVRQAGAAASGMARAAARAVWTMLGGRHVEETAEKSGPPRAGDHGEPGEAATGDG